MVCDESKEQGMLSNCNICESHFKKEIMKNIREKRKMIERCQWTMNHGRAVKQTFSGKSKRFPSADFVVTIVRSVLKCAKQLHSRTAQSLWHVYVKTKLTTHRVNSKTDILLVI